VTVGTADGDALVASRDMFAASAVVGRQAARAIARRGIHAGRPALGGADEPVRVRRRRRERTQRGLLGSIER